MTKHRQPEENNSRHTTDKKSPNEVEGEKGPSFLKDGEQLIVIPIRRPFATRETWVDDPAENNRQADGGTL